MVTHTKKTFFFFIVGFCIFGLVLIYDASVAESLSTFGHPWHYAQYQAIWFVIGLVAFIATSFIPLDIWKALAPLIFIGAIGLLILVLIPGIGTETLGAQRRIVLGPVNIQPAEITKLALILFYAHWLEKHQRFAPFLLLTGVVFLLIMLQPNLSTAFITVALATVMYFLAGGKIQPLVIFGGVGALLLAILILSAPYRRERLLTFLNPASDPLGRSYHIRQITLALGRGGLFGQGIGLSKQKQQYIPEVSTDSIFAILAEEAGFIGAVLLLGAYGLLLSTGYTISLEELKAKDHFRFLVAAGITTWLALHIVLNVAAMVALVPLTGIPLPLVSYGGSSFVSIMIGLGILWGVLKQSGNRSGQTRNRVAFRSRKR
ncbi:putative lipid II flippase FtsW [Candidatus Woesebacteria bacterium]|nr:putative lipid II flippase FtsW [Candidatus Woesebacteria bacterium]